MGKGNGSTRGSSSGNPRGMGNSEAGLPNVSARSIGFKQRAFDDGIQRNATYQLNDYVGKQVEFYADSSDTARYDGVKEGDLVKAYPRIHEHYNRGLTGVGGYNISLNREQSQTGGALRIGGKSNFASYEEAEAALVNYINQRRKKK